MKQQDSTQLEQQWLTQLTEQTNASFTHFRTMHPNDRPLTPEEIASNITYLQNLEYDFRKYVPVALSLKASGFSRLSEQLQRVLDDILTTQQQYLVYLEMYHKDAMKAIYTASNAAQAICVMPNAACNNCRRSLSQLPYDIRIDSIETTSASWVLHGSGKPQPDMVKVSHRCPMCSAIYEAIQYIIPIECAPYPCPICGQFQDLKYQIHRIQTEEDSFQFEAEITCRKCGSRKSIQEVFKKVLEVLKITIGPTGVTVSKA